MEPKFLKICLLSMGLLFFGSFNLFGQANALATGKASLDKTGKVMIEKDLLTHDNVFDLSEMDEPARKNTIADLSKKNTPLVTFMLDEAKGELHVHLELRMRPDWTVEDWNQYLATL